jgi:tRNA(fMet)-specific endonuclease VapC
VSNRVLAEGFKNIAVSDITRAELYYGAFKSKRIDENLTAVRTIIEHVNFLPFNEPAQLQFGKTKATLEKSGNRLDDMDIMIASIALTFNLVLVTNNTGHFDRIQELNMENWI